MQDALEVVGHAIDLYESNPEEKVDWHRTYEQCLEDRREYEEKHVEAFREWAVLVGIEI
jgi:hypothetical protein